MAASLGLYLSVPFCRSKCTYCNFASGVFPAALEQPYVERLLAEIAGVRARAEEWGVSLARAVDSIYWGGGTPGVLPAAGLRGVWRRLRSEFDVAPDAEITVECAPGQMPEASLDAMLEGGVNRVSFGVQSFVDRETSSAGRLHTRKTALEEIDRFRAAGIRNINVDLIAGLPHQTLSSWRESLGILTATGVAHASIYMLEVDEDSRLGRELIRGGGRYHAGSAPCEDQVAEFYELAVEDLESHGRMRYEISNFARPGCESRHNGKYWRREPYVGFGLDAHSMLRRQDGGVLRYSTCDSLDGYFATGAVSPEIMEVGLGEQLSEAWFLGLRLRQGVSWSALEAEFGAASLEPFRSSVEDLERLDLLVEEDGRIRLTPRGILLSNEVFARFL